MAAILGDELLLFGVLGGPEDVAKSCLKPSIAILVLLVKI